MMRLLLALLLILLIPTNANAVAGVEARCTQLIDDGDGGTTCICSEQLDSTDTYLSVSDTSHDWTDSPHATSCASDAPNSAQTPGSVVTLSSAAGNARFTNVAENVSGLIMPAGNTVTNVLRIGPQSEGTGGDVIWLEARQLVFNTDQRMCMRFYKRVDDDYSGAGFGQQTVVPVCLDDPCPLSNISCYTERNKLLQMAFGNELLQLEDQSNDQGCWGPNVGFCGGTPHEGTCAPEGQGCYDNQCDIVPGLKSPTGVACADIVGYEGDTCIAAGHKNLVFENTVGGTPANTVVGNDECNRSSGWCRIEMCVSGNLSAGTGIKEEMQIWTQSGDNTYTLTASTSETYSSGLGGSGVDVGGDWYHGEQGGGGPAIGAGYFSHFMQASWATDSGQWIGAASEVEGGAAAAPSITGASISGGSVQ